MKFLEKSLGGLEFICLLQEDWRSISVLSLLTSGQPNYDRLTSKVPSTTGAPTRHDHTFGRRWIWIDQFGNIRFTTSNTEF